VNIFKIIEIQKWEIFSKKSKSSFPKIVRNYYKLLLS